MRFLTIVCLMALLSLPAFAQDPFVGPERFPEFRNLSGLAGSGYGVDAQGYPSLSGPVAYSSPVAHVLGHGHLRVVIGNNSLDAFPSISTDRTNGTAFGTYGHTFGRWNVSFTTMVLAVDGDTVGHLQAQYIPAASSRLVGSVGVQAFYGANKAEGNDERNDPRSSRSAFGVLTYRVETGCGPLYVSAGIGTRRYKKGFASASYQVVGPVRLWIEQDGFGFNEGALLSWRTGKGRRAVEINFAVGFLQGRYFTAAFGLGF